METKKPVLNNPYVVLSDHDTYDGIDTSHIFFLTEEGNEELCNNGDMKEVAPSMITHIVSIAELVEVYEMYVNRNKSDGNW
jgi:hypothetical protein